MFALKTKKDIPDEELAMGCSRGKEEYCKMLFEKYYGRMLNVCRRYAKDQDEAKDMLQEGFIRVFKNISQYQHRGSLEGWIRRTVVTTAINYYKKYSMNGSVSYMEEDILTVASENGSSLFAANNVAETMDAKQLLAMTHTLSPVYRTVFNLSAIEGYSHQEIGEMLDITESTSRSNLAKARQKLQQMLKQAVQTKKIHYETQ